MSEPADVSVRPEQPADAKVIRDITHAAFEGRPYAAGDEHELIGALRAKGALFLSLVAEQEGQVVGQVSFSPAVTEDAAARWFTLGPVAVTPDLQSRGIGSRLINEGLSILTERGAAGCILTGNPNYYQRFGFELTPDQAPDEDSKPHFMVKNLNGTPPPGLFRFHPLFDDTDT